MIRNLLIIVIFVLPGISSGQIDYNLEIQPIFNNSCTSCHDSDHSSGLDLLSYSTLMAGGVIIPYDHTNSELYDRITRDESADGDMPPTGSLTQGEINIIAQWIDEGALGIPGSNSGCTDSEAYNCADDDGVNYTFEVGALTFVNGCNYDLDDYSQITYIGGCEDGPCEGFYNPGAITDDGSCDYYQAPHDTDVEFIVADNGINVDWSGFVPPQNANVIGYIIQRCTASCVFITGNPFPWPNGSGIGYTETSFFDAFDWEESLDSCGEDCAGQVKYAINVHYSNAESYGMAIGTSYVTPGGCPAAMGDLNGDSAFNVLDIVGLANCVLANNCTELENGCAGDMNSDSAYNVLDIVALANCVLANNCGS